MPLQHERWNNTYNPNVKMMNQRPNTNMPWLGQNVANGMRNEHTRISSKTMKNKKNMMNKILNNKMKGTMMNKNKIMNNNRIRKTMNNKKKMPMNYYL